MIIGTVKFPGLVGNDKRKQNKYLSQLKKNAVILCKQYSRGSNRYIADLNKRLNLIKDYIKKVVANKNDVLFSKVLLILMIVGIMLMAIEWAGLIS